MVKDPVCGEQVNERASVETTKVGNQSFYFCSVACKKQFEADPKKYAAVAKKK